MAVTSVGTSVSLLEAQKQAAKKTSTNELGTDTFMTLMLTQMRNQNPMEPMNDTEMISQMAQLNSVTQLQKMSTSMSSVEHLNQLLSASGMMGKTVSYKDSTGNLFSGLVSSVTIDGTSVNLTVGQQSISISSVLKIG
jgi:flagellar basal-body rod modification protein FlgD